jgi:hypothetical protein
MAGRTADAVAFTAACERTAQRVQVDAGLLDSLRAITAPLASPLVA